MFAGISSKIMIAQFVAMLLMATAGYFYFKHSQSVIEGLSADKARLETAVSIQQATIDAQQEAAMRQNASSFTLQQQLAEADRSRRDLESTLRRRNLEAMARANSTDFERRINQATIRAFRDIENITQPSDRPAAAPSTPPVEQTTTTIAPQPQAAPSTIPSNYQPPPRPPRTSVTIGNQR